MKRLAALLFSLLVIGGVSVLVYRNNDWAGAQPAAGAASQPAVRVQVVAAAQKPFPVEIGTIGTVTALATVAIKSRIDGQIMDAYIKDGQDVKTGDLLFSIDSRTIATQLVQAEANLARDQALLASAKHDVERQTALVSKNFASKQLLDQTSANADSLAASVRADQAAVDAANVQLTYTEIRAPIDGRAGVVNLPRGNMVKANDTSALVVLNQLRPIYVAFAVPQNDLPHIREAMAAAALGASVTIPGDERGPLTGKLTFVDNAVDTTTGTIQLRATFDNADTRLWPGQFVNVALTLRTDPSAIVVPDAAIEHGQSGNYVFVVRKDSTVEMRTVTIGRSLRGETVVERGLSAGEPVVVEGQLRLAPGTRVEPRPAGQLPSADTTS
jgi:multidrug efflux system membrane fusion protein